MPFLRLKWWTILRWLGNVRRVRICLPSQIVAVNLGGIVKIGNVLKEKCYITGTLGLCSRGGKAGSGSERPLERAHL